MTCNRRLWGDTTGLACHRTDSHNPGPSTCRYQTAWTTDAHDATEARQEDQR